MLKHENLGGTHNGVMKLVGEAVAQAHGENLKVLGIATWGVIAFRKKLVIIFKQIKLS
jgi:hypothetical protein